MGLPLRLISVDWYKAWVSYSKQLFCILIIFITQQWTPLNVTITGDLSTKGLFEIDPDTKLFESHFDPRAIVISNHQLYSDWVYLWWVAFTSKFHGNIYIMLKDSLKNIPIFGWGMRFYKFIFLSRKWAKDQKIMAENLGRINADLQSPAWLILFPEGTTLSKNGVMSSTAYADKQIPPKRVPEHCLLPRTTGLRFSIEQLHESVEYIYDATIAYSGIPDGVFGEDYYTLKKMYLHGVFTPSISIYWRKYKISDIPWQDEVKFEKWLYDLWYEKDKLLDSRIRNGEFENPTGEPILKPMTAPLRLYNTAAEVFKIFAVPITTGLLVRLGCKAWSNIS